MRIGRRSKGSEVPANDASHTRKPKDTPFLQQTLKAWRPVVTQKYAIAAFSLLGIFFLPIGIALLIMSTKVREVRIEYTACHRISQLDQFEALPSENIDMQMRSPFTKPLRAQWKRSDKALTFDQVRGNYTQCTIDFHLPEALEPPVLIYYRLTNFMQNYRKYAHSRSSDQLKGMDASLDSVRKSCKALGTDTEDATGRETIVYPCGLIANSVFNDTFENPQLLLNARTPESDSRQIPYKMSTKGIAPVLDKPLYKTTSYAVHDEAGGNESIIVPPPNWAERYPKGYHSGNMFDPTKDEAFMVWMHNAASPDFTKLAMRNDEETMSAGTYRLVVMSHFPIHKSGGRKYVVITNPAGFGRRKHMGVAYIIVGGLGTVFAVTTAFSLLRKDRPFREHRYLCLY